MAESMDTDDEFDGALTALREAHGQAVAALRALPATQNTFRSASEFADALREMADVAADERALTAARIAEAEKLSLAGLASKISVSRSRAGQLLQSAKKVRKRTDPERDQRDV